MHSTNHGFRCVHALLILTLAAIPNTFSEDIPASPIPAIHYDRPEEQLPPVAGRLFSRPAVGYLTGTETPWLVLSTSGHGAGTYLYRLSAHPRHRWVAGPAEDMHLPNASQTIVDWDQDGTDDLLRMENGAYRLYLMTPGAERPTPFQTVDLAYTNGKRIELGGEHLSVVFRGGVPDIVVSFGRSREYFPGEGGVRDEQVSLGGGYDESGLWRWDFGTGFVHYLENQGTAAAPEFSRPRTLQSGRGYVTATHSAYVTAHDWTGDGLFDLNVADFNGQLWFFKNIGTSKEPYFDLATPLRDPEGETLALPQCMARNAAFDWDGDGLQDLIVGSEDSFVYAMRCAGKDTYGYPVFEKPEFVRGVDGSIDLGVLTVQNFADWDEDGDRDIIIGNTAGEIVVIENAGTDGDPKYKLYRPLLSDGKPFRKMAMATGSTQGPNEATWGYCCPSVTDWNGDGLLDGLLGDITGYTTVYLNDGKGNIDNGHELTVYGKRYRTVWRVRPVPVDWDSDGELEIVYLDPKGRLGIHERGETAFDLKPLQPFRMVDGSEINRDGDGGMEGRWKLCVVDWDGDGDLDVITGVKGGTQLAEQTGPFSKIIWFERMGTEEGPPTFAAPKTLGTEAGPFQLGDHTLCPEPYFYPGREQAQKRDPDGDGFNLNPRIQYLSLTSEDGRLYRVDRDIIRVVR